MSTYTMGIDVSEHNGVIDWEKVKASGVGFAMIRGGYGRTVEKQFKRNISECNRIGLPCGVYWFSYALNAVGAAEEAKVCLEAIAPYTVDLPVAFDLEYDSVDYAKKQGVMIGTKLAFVTIGGGTELYPLTKKNCAQVTACAVRTRTRYATRVSTTATGGSFKLLGDVCCVSTNTLDAIDGTAPAAPGA